MSDKICLPTSHILIIFCIFIGLSAWYIHNDKKKNLDEINYKFNDSILDIINKKLSEKQLNSNNKNELKILKKEMKN